MRIELSIVVVNFNGAKYIRDCVKSIKNSSAKNFEIIIVDNGSKYKEKIALRKLLEKHDNLKIIRLDKNYGPAKARNVGVKQSKGEFLCFLDNDTVVDKDWSLGPVKVLKSEEKIGVIQSKLLLQDDKKKIDYVGEFIGQNGFLVQRCPAGEIDSGQFEKRVEILAAKSAGMFMRKTAFIKAGGFDEDYFIYVEETDLAWRSWLSGFRSIYLPSSVVFHKFGTSSIILRRDVNDFNAKFHGTKNYIRTLIKNLELKSLIEILPVHVTLWLGLAWFSLLSRRPRSFVLIHKAILWNIIHLGDTLVIRKTIQEKRAISDKILFRTVMIKRPIGYFINKVTKGRKIGNAESFIRSK